MKSFEAKIFISGDITKIKDVCAAFCECNDLCVSVIEMDFVFTGGTEKGACIGLIQYPRFPKDTQTIVNQAKSLVTLLLYECHQRSCTLMYGDEVEFFENDRIHVPR